ncbi:MAG: pilus assembly protein PilM [Candidatus Eremiobacteraeota bacterium]|nr:pilus assembly protein PilM [Candidatus Eremiobacteraeota bacterium]
MALGKKYLGLDIGSYSIKLGVCEQNRKDIENLSEIELFPERKFMDQGPDENNKPEKVKKILSEHMAPGSRSGNSLNICVQGDGEISGYAELPKLKPDQEDLAVKSIARKCIPYTLKEAVITYKAVPPVSGKKEKTGIFFISIHHESFDAYRDILTECGCKADNFIMASFALVNSHSVNYEKNPDKFSVLVNCGSLLTTIVFIRNGFPYFMRNFTIAGANFTYAFQMGLQLTWQESQKQKCAYDVLAKEVFFEPVLSRWLEQVKKSIDGFKNINRAYSPGLDKIYLAGGSSQLKNLDRRISEFTGMEVIAETWKNLEKRSVSDEKKICVYNTALGAILQT